MTDQFDRAQKLEIDEWERRQRVAIRPRLVRESSLSCHHCGDPIPEALRKAVPGCQLCVECQTDQEHQGNFA